MSARKFEARYKTTTDENTDLKKKVQDSEQQVHCYRSLYYRGHSQWLGIIHPTDLDISFETDIDSAYAESARLQGIIDNYENGYYY